MKVTTGKNKDFCSFENDSAVKKGFIGLDGNHYEYEKGDDYCWHSHMTNEEWMKMNNNKQLTECQKCPMWENCRNKEHTIFTEYNLIEACTAELSDEINKNIVERLKSQIN